LNYQFAISVLIVVATAAALLLLRKVLFQVLYRLAKKTVSRIDDLLLEGIEGIEIPFPTRIVQMKEIPALKRKE
jgi:hypothetical protein